MDKEIFDDLDEFEQALEDDFENSKSVPNLAQRIAEARKAAGNTLKKDKKITIRLSSGNIHELKRIAANEGIPYQTLITNILHRYASNWRHDDKH